MEFWSLSLAMSCSVAALFGPVFLIFGLLLDREAFWVGVVMVVAGNAIGILGFGQEPIFYLQWIGF